MRLKDYQIKFARFLRDPRGNPFPPHFSSPGMKEYPRLIFNSFEEVLGSCFPILKKLLGKVKWKALIRDFLKSHSCLSPFYREIPDEFMAYLEKERKTGAKDPPFLFSLAHYEWLELTLFLKPEKNHRRPPRQIGGRLHERPSFTSALELESYPFRVHEIGPRHRPRRREALPVFYLIFRNGRGKVEFKILNAVSARFLDLLLHRKMKVLQALKKIQKEIRHPDFKVLLKSGEKLLEGLRKKGAIL